MTSTNDKNSETIDLFQLRNSEENVLRYAIQSINNYSEVLYYMLDFTFYINRSIYQNIGHFSDKFDDNISRDRSKLKYEIEKFANYLAMYYRIDELSIINILSQPPGEDIQKDIEIVNNRSLEKRNAKHSFEKEKEVIISTEHGKTWAYFQHNILLHVKTTKSGGLPSEIHSSFRDTFQFILNSESKNKESKVAMTIHEYSTDPDKVNSVHLTS